MDALAIKTLSALTKALQELQRCQSLYTPPHGTKGKWNSSCKKLQSAAAHWDELSGFILDILKPPRTTRNQRITRRPHISKYRSH